MARSRNSVFRAVCLGIVFLALGLQGCREDEQGRVVFHEKGAYAGKSDQKLSDAQINALRLRAANQQQ
jgi:hypothetical protein